MDSKGCSLPAMLEPTNPFSMKQPPESLSGRKSRGDMSDDPGHLMDKAAAQLAATLQDSVLQKMANNHNNHGHERLKDLTSRVLNGDQDKMPKLCAPEPPALKSTDAPSSLGSPHQRKGASPSSPELKLKITKMVKQQQQQPRFEPCCAEGHSLATAAEAILSASNQGKEVRKRKGRPCKPKHKPRLKLASSTIPGVVPFIMTVPEDQTGTAEKAYPLSEVLEAPPLQPSLSLPEVQMEPPLQASLSLHEVQMEPPLQPSLSLPEVQMEPPLQPSPSLPEVQMKSPLQPSPSLPEVQMEPPLQASLSLPEVQMEPPLQPSLCLPKVVHCSRAEPCLQIGYSVGDVVWTKVSGYPWWPCVVTTDPELNKHVKQKQKAANGRPLGLLYHVQYFGDAPERGYVFERSMVAFHGEEQYHHLGPHRNKQPMSHVLHRKAAPSVPRKLRTQWSIGVSQAKEAVSMALQERMATFTFAYDQDGPHLNPLVLEKLMPAQTRPAEEGEEAKKTKEEEEKQAHDRSRLNPVFPTHVDTTAMSTTSPPPRDRSTSKGRKTPAPKKPRIKPVKQRKLPVSLLKQKGKSVKTKKPSKEKPQTESTSEEPSTLLVEAESKVLEPQKRKRKPSLKYQPTLKTVQRKKSKPDSLPASDVLETVTQAPSAPAKPNNPRKKRPALGINESKATAFTQIKRRERKKSTKRPPTETVATEPQPKKRRRATKGVENKQSEVSLLKATVTGDTTTKKLRNRKTKEVNGIKKKRVKIWTVLPTDDKVPEKPKRIRKQKRESGNQLATSQAKKRRSSLCPEPEGSGSEGRPESPSDSLDGTKKNGPKKEFVCQVCEHTGEDLILCEGQCCGTYHLHCLGLSLKPQGKLLCPECSAGVHPCFCCKQTEGETRRCNVLHCGRFYHEACVRLNHLTVFDNKGFRCPLHTCLSCHYSNRAKATKGKMIRCLRCPVSYHSGEMCVAAGSEMITSNAIVCTNHFSAKKGYSHHSHVNVSWCFICSKGGRLLCCESCPSAFHPDCLNIAMPEGSWFCNDCRAGKKPKYRDIIWVKLGNYRWWPAEIRHPRSVPTNIQHLRHEIGEFPVFFFGSKDYFWTHQGRVFPYMEGDRGSKYQKSGIGKVFKKALLDAETRFKLLRMEREAKEAQKNDRKPPPYKYIKTNRPCGKVQVYTADASEIPKCNCKPTDDKPCGFESECLNRMLMYECHPQVCPSGERCCNQDFTKRLYPETKIVRTAGKGWGLVSLRDIKKGEFVNEYVGELIDEEECRARIKYAQENDISHFYMLTLDKDRVIDAGPKGNYSRFMNHSCQPNTETLKWTVNGDTRVGLFAVGDIPAGTELTFNYNLDCLGNEKTVCRCGAPNCSGFLGDRPKASSGQTAEPKGKKLKKKRRSRNDVRKPSEDECFRCGDGGQLVLCDKKCCTKAYHLSCLDRTKRPFGRWDCPWHHCDVCGKNSEAFCQLCPNSFCKVHQEGALRVWTPTGQLCCLEHEELPDTETQGPVQTPPHPGTEAPRPLKGSRNTKTEA